MAGSIYDDKLIEPTFKMLEVDLLSTKKHVDAVIDFIETNYNHVKPEWKYYNKKSGWILKIFNKKRNVLFIVPCKGYFKVAFVFGDKAYQLVLENELISQEIKTELTEAKIYMEGRIIHIDVNNTSNCTTILELIKIKMS